MSAGVATILVVDDESDVLELMRDCLEADGYQVETASDGEAASSLLSRRQIDCVLLDVMLPDCSGFELCRRVRMTSNVPVLFLSARDGDVDKVRGLGIGADDYIVKSATPAEVAARIKAVLRRLQPLDTPAAPLLMRGRIGIDVSAREVVLDGRSVALTAKEFDLLVFLAKHPRQVFTRAHLMEAVWGTHGDGRVVTVLIGNLREKIEPQPSCPIFVTTVRGVGYRFEGQPG
jgi:DNA-binding response OmpR family regulator